LESRNEYIGVGVRIILKWMLTRLILFKIGSTFGPFWTLFNVSDPAVFA